jgi:hypothetical protein
MRRLGARTRIAAPDAGKPGIGEIIGHAYIMAANCDREKSIEGL